MIIIIWTLTLLCLLGRLTGNEGCEYSFSLSRCKGKVNIERLSGRDAFYEVVSWEIASKVVHLLIPPQNVFDLAEIRSSRMRLWTEGRM